MQGVDLANSMLIYECSGLDVSADPGLLAVAATALAAKPTDPSADILTTAGTILPNDLPTATTAGTATITAAPNVDPTDPLLGLDAYGETGHRHHRHLMQSRSNAEIASGWLVSQTLRSMLHPVARSLMARRPSFSSFPNLLL
jgi:hypothetical protein